MKQFKYIILASSMLLLAFASCSKKIEDAYLNPNADVKKPIEELLPGVIDNMLCSGSANGSNYGVAYDAMYFGHYIQFWTRNTAQYQYDQMGGVTGGSDLLGNIWAMHYYGQGQNIVKIVEWGTEEQKWDYVGVATAIRAWAWLTLTDTYGEVILKEAFNTSQRVFSYDTQREVYAEVRRLCHVALNYLNMTGGNVSQENLAKGDKYMNNGDVNKWKKFVYGVLARSFHRETNKSFYAVDSVLKYVDLAATTNADNTISTFNMESLHNNAFHFWGQRRGNIGGNVQSKFIADLVSGINPTFTDIEDPRAAYILQENAEGKYKGYRPTWGPESLPTAQRPKNFFGGATGTTTAPGAKEDSARYVFRDKPPFPVMTACEMKFIKAEALYRKGGTNKAAALQAYREGIELSMNMLKDVYTVNSIWPGRQLTASAINDFINNSGIVPDLADFTLSHIMLQKFIALYGFGVIETWVDLRRYHYVDTENGTTRQVYDGFELPIESRRFVNNTGKVVYRARPRYNSEYLYNTAALTAVGAMELNYHTKEMWFSIPE